MDRFTPRVVKWSAHELLGGVTTDHVTASPELRRAVRRNLWGDMCAEYDSEHLWQHLNTGGFDFSTEFRSALAEWRSDERNHYVGLRHICSTMYDVAEEEIDTEMTDRRADFSAIQGFLTDEFRICVVLAYDELVSSRGYRLFFDSFGKFGPPQYSQWVRWACRDEAWHYQNFLDVIRMVHPNRLPGVAGVIREIEAYESSPAMTYHGTFLLDHTGETLGRDFLVDCGRTVIKQCMGISADVRAL
jgi:hypothetical protein